MKHTKCPQVHNVKNYYKFCSFPEFSCFTVNLSDVHSIFTQE